MENRYKDMQKKGERTQGFKRVISSSTDKRLILFSRLAVGGRSSIEKPPERDIGVTSSSRYEQISSAYPRSSFDLQIITSSQDIPK